MTLRYLSVCAGIEAVTVAWHHMGWQPLAFSEIEKFPRSVLQHHYPDVPLHGDFTKLRDEEWIADADLLVGGTPCQAFSVAGLRQSLADDRGNLSLEFVRLANAIDHLRPVGRASIVVWENVPGVLSVKDNAFGCFLAALVGNDTPLVPTGGKWTNAGMVVGPQRVAAWRILDAQYFGVAQRRRRVFVVASSRDGFDPAEVLFEREGLCRNIAPRRGEGQRVADSLTVGANQYSGFTGEPVAHTLTAHTGIKPPDTESYVVGPLACNTGPNGHDAGNFACNQAVDAGHILPIAFHPTQDPISSDDGSTHALGCGSSQGQATIAVAVNIYGGNKRPDRPEGGFYVRMDEETSKTLDAASGLNPTAAQGGTAVMQTVAFDWKMGAKAGSVGYSEEQSPTLSTGADRYAVAFYANEGSHGMGNNEDVSVTIKADQKNAAAVATDLYNGTITGDVAATMGTQGSSVNSSGPTVLSSMAVRRLTPKECERLQGFPDDWTNIPGASDSARYKALGNSMAVPVMRWIGERIKKEISK